MIENIDFKVEKVAVLGDGKWGSRVYDLLTNPKRHEGKTRSYHASIIGPETDDQGNVVMDAQGKAIWGDASRETLSEADLVFAAIPVKNYRETIQNLKYSFKPNAFVVNGSKGCEYDSERKTIYLPHEILRQELNESNKKWIASLCGPNIQYEIGKEPFRATSAEVACYADWNDWSEKKQYLRFLSEFFSVDKYTVVGNPNILGIELSAALKNIFANGAGIIGGYYDTKNAHNTRATLLALADYDIQFIFAEISKEKQGWSVKVPAIAGLGDLIATCTSEKSRNYSFGYERGRDFREKQPGKELKTADEICKEIGQVVESINTLESIMKLSDERDWTKELLIVPFIYEMVHGKSHIEEIYSRLNGLRERLTKRNELLYLRDLRRYRGKQRDKK